MRVLLGYDQYGWDKEHKVFPVYWNTQEVINGHILMVGKSGTGKTYNLLRILEQLDRESNHQVKAHIFDVHGDIDVPGASTVKFSEATQYGFNPLIVNPDPDFGGVRKRIQAFIAALNRTSRQLGTKQESVLRNILVDLYSANGFKETNSSTWVLDDGVQRRYPKKYPTLEDAFKFATYKLKSLYFGSNSLAVKYLETLNKKVSSLNNKRKQAARGGIPDAGYEAQESEIKDLTEQTIDAYADYVRSIQTGMEMDDLIRYDSKEVLKSLTERLDNLNAIGIFKNIAPPFDRQATNWRYNIKALSTDEKKLFVEFRLEELFLQSVQRGVSDEIRDVIILDEAHLFFSADEDNILNTIAKEARKFGLALICASQSPKHFSDDFVSNVGTKIILGIDQMFWDDSVRKLKIDPKVLQFITPQRTMAVQINRKGDLRNNFRSVMFQRPTP